MRKRAEPQRVGTASVTPFELQRTVYLAGEGQKLAAAQVLFGKIIQKKGEEKNQRQSNRNYVLSILED